jgi:hypothetical protein
VEATDLFFPISVARIFSNLAKGRRTTVAANIYVYCPAGAGGLSRCDLEEALERFFGCAAEDCGAGTGATGFNLEYELAEGEDPHAWADRLKPFLASIGVRPGTSSMCFPTAGSQAQSGGASKCSARIGGVGIAQQTDHANRDLNLYR